MVLAGASVDDVFVIVLFTSFTGMAQGGRFSPAALVGGGMGVAALLIFKRSGLLNRMLAELGREAPHG